MSVDADGSNVARQFKTRTGRRISAERVKRLARTRRFRLPAIRAGSDICCFAIARSKPRGASGCAAKANDAATAELPSYSDAWDCEPSAVRFDPATRTRNREIRSRMCAIVDCISTQHSCSVVMCASRSVTSSARWSSVPHVARWTTRDRHDAGAIAVFRYAASCGGPRGFVAPGGRANQIDTWRVLRPLPRTHVFGRLGAIGPS